MGTFRHSGYFTHVVWQLFEAMASSSDIFCTGDVCRYLSHRTEHKISFSIPSPGKRSKTRAKEGLGTRLYLRSVERLVKLFHVDQCHRKSDIGILRSASWSISVITIWLSSHDIRRMYHYLTNLTLCRNLETHGINYQTIYNYIQQEWLYV